MEGGFVDVKRPRAVMDDFHHDLGKAWESCTLLQDTQDEVREHLVVIASILVLQDFPQNRFHLRRGERPESRRRLPQRTKPNSLALQRSQQRPFLIVGEPADVAVQPHADRIAFDEVRPGLPWNGPRAMRTGPSSP